MKRSLRVVCAFFLFGALAMVAAMQAPALGEEGSKVDRLLDLLQQKGVITADEAADLKKEVETPAPAARVAPPQQEKPKVNIKGHLRLQGQWTENDATANNDTLRIRQARVTFFGEPAPNYTWTIGFAAERTDPTLLDATIEYRYSPELSLTAGQFKIPISRESLESGSKLDLLERAWVLDRFRGANARDIGVKMTWLPLENLQLEVGAYHGNGKNASDSNDQKLWVGRLSSRLKAGDVSFEPEVAYLYAPSEDAGAPPFEADLRNPLKTPGFTSPYDKIQKQWGLVTSYDLWTLKYEYMQGRYSPQSGANVVIADGRYLQLGAKITKKLLSFLRAEDFDANLRTTSATDVNWYTFGLKYDYRKNLTYKLNYTWKKEAITPVNNDVLGMEMQVTY